MWSMVGHNKTPATLVLGCCHCYGIVLLLLAAPTWLWGRCGRHNSPPTSAVMDFIFRRPDGSHVSVDTVHTSLLRPSSSSSPRWYISRVKCSQFLLLVFPNHRRLNLPLIVPSYIMQIVIPYNVCSIYFFLLFLQSVPFYASFVVYCVFEWCRARVMAPLCPVDRDINTQLARQFP